MIASNSFKQGIAVDSLYLSSQHKEAVARLKYVVNSKGFGVLSGHPGTGKSTIIRSLDSSLDKNKYVVCYINESLLKPATLYSRILDSLNIKPLSFLSKLKKQFKDSVYSLYKSQNKSLVIIIDNAQALPESTVKEIRFLIGFEMDSFSPLSIILAGHSDLWDTLKLRSFELVFQCISNHYRLMPLDERQTQEYIVHNLKLSDQNMLFPEDVTKQIYSYTRGIPRIINRVCNDCLLDMEQHDLEIVDSTVLERVINELSF
jgi:type II secretory pathway predicted ATPase ExeA